jgi:hypothetical protein
MVADQPDLKTRLKGEMFVEQKSGGNRVLTGDFFNESFVQWCFVLALSGLNEACCT